MCDPYWCSWPPCDLLGVTVGNETDVREFLYEFLMWRVPRLLFNISRLFSEAFVSVPLTWEKDLCLEMNAEAEGAETFVILENIWSFPPPLVSLYKRQNLFFFFFFWPVQLLRDTTPKVCMLKSIWTRIEPRNYPWCVVDMWLSIHPFSDTYVGVGAAV